MRAFLNGRVKTEVRRLLAAAVNSTLVAGEILTVGSGPEAA